MFDYKIIEKNKCQLGEAPIWHQNNTSSRSSSTVQNDSYREDEDDGLKRLQSVINSSRMTNKYDDANENVNNGDDDGDDGGF